MPFTNLSLVFPQLIMTIGIITILLLAAFKTPREGDSRYFALIAILFLGIATWITVIFPYKGNISEILQFDYFSLFFLLFAITSASLTLVFSISSKEISTSRFPEYATLLLTICIGVSMMAAARDMLVAYLAMEMASLSSYIITGFKRNDKASHEAALKYIIFGGVASGIMLFGMSLLYGFSGSTSFTMIARTFYMSSSTIPSAASAQFPIFIALVFLFSGFFFKIAATPFHMWCPDVYQGAPTPFAGFLSVAPKAGGFALIVRFLSEIFDNKPDQVTFSVLALIGLISAATMIIGNLTAIHQTSVKRLLAYSSIAHAGYLLMGVTVLNQSGFAAILIYLIVYLFMNIGAFAVVQTVFDSRGNDDIASFRGLGFTAPAIAVSMAIFLFSLAGLPPLAGFIGKFYIFSAVIKAGGFWYIMLAIIGILNSVVGLFYYTRIIREMFLTQPDNPNPLFVDKLNKGLIGFLLIPVIIFGVYWEPLAKIVLSAGSVLRLR